MSVTCRRCAEYLSVPNQPYSFFFASLLILEGHNGNIRADNTIGKGAVVTVLIPEDENCIV
jgi:hypothetical protein